MTFEERDWSSKRIYDFISHNPRLQRALGSVTWYIFPPLYFSYSVFRAVQIFVISFINTKVIRLIRLLFISFGRMEEKRSFSFLFIPLWTQFFLTRHIVELNLEIDDFTHSLLLFTTDRYYFFSYFIWSTVSENVFLKSLWTHQFVTSPRSFVFLLNRSFSFILFSSITILISYSRIRYPIVWLSDVLVMNAYVISAINFNEINSTFQLS